jgi:hypothetical protein
MGNDGETTRHKQRTQTTVCVCVNTSRSPIALPSQWPPAASRLARPFENHSNAASERPTELRLPRPTTHLREGRHQLQVTNSRCPPAAIDYGSNTKLPSERVCENISFPPDRAQLPAQNRQWPPAASRLARLVETTGVAGAAASSEAAVATPARDQVAAGSLQDRVDVPWSALFLCRSSIRRQQTAGDLPSPIRVIHSPHWLPAAFWQGSCSGQAPRSSVLGRGRASCHTTFPSARFNSAWIRADPV